MTWRRISQIIVTLPNVEAETPFVDHGETEDKPSPAPSASRIHDNAAVANAPPITAPHDTPDEYDSLLIEVSIASTGYRAAGDECVISAIKISSMCKSQRNVAGSGGFGPDSNS